jgi:hypothetical protein
VPDYELYFHFISKGTNFPDEAILFAVGEEEDETPHDWKTKNQKLIPYHQYLEDRSLKFRRITFNSLSRTKNPFADALVKPTRVASTTNFLYVSYFSP